MNRRDFTRGLLSLGALPALPVPAMAVPARATAASAGHMYFMGWYTARMNKTCSPEMLVSELKVSPDVAKDIFGRLVKNKAVSAPNALGVSQTIDPLPQRLSSRIRVPKKAELEKVSRLQDKLDMPSVEDVSEPPRAEQDTTEELNLDGPAPRGEETPMNEQADDAFSPDPRQDH